MKAVTLLLILIFVVRAAAHGFMKTPRTRGAYCSNEVKPNLQLPEGCKAIDYCPHCLNGGGVGSVRKALKGNFSPYRSDNRVRAGLCGDALGTNDHMVGGKYVPYEKAPIVAGYEPGSAIDFEIHINTNHNGFMVFYLCDLDACGTTDLEQKCFTGGHCKKLERISISRCEKGDKFECGPIDEMDRTRWYVPCRGGGQKDKGGKSGTVRYQLPNNMNCKHCVVQFYWVTANSCNPVNYRPYFESKPFGTCAGDGGAKGGINEVLADCGGDNFPEEFWGCADVTIQNGASTLSLSQLQGLSSRENNSEKSNSDTRDLTEKDPVTEVNKTTTKPTESKEAVPKSEEKNSAEAQANVDSGDTRKADKIPNKKEGQETADETMKDPEKKDTGINETTSEPTSEPTTRGRNSPTPSPTMIHDAHTAEQIRADNDSNEPKPTRTPSPLRKPKNSVATESERRDQSMLRNHHHELKKRYTPGHGIFFKYGGKWHKWLH